MPFATHAAQKALIRTSQCILDARKQETSERATRIEASQPGKASLAVEWVSKTNEWERVL